VLAYLFICTRVNTASIALMLSHYLLLLLFIFFPNQVVDLYFGLPFQLAAHWLLLANINLIIVGGLIQIYKTCDCNLIGFFPVSIQIILKWSTNPTLTDDATRLNYKIGYCGYSHYKC